MAHSCILGEPQISERMVGLKERYGHRELVPFALRLDCDDVACWVQKSMPQVVIIRDFANIGWESDRPTTRFGIGFGPPSAIASNLKAKLARPLRSSNTFGEGVTIGGSNPLGTVTEDIIR
ncbi:MAG: hypothetical protein WBL63_10315 [Candidatus Acidiferrum sp.]